MSLTKGQKKNKKASPSTSTIAIDPFSDQDPMLFNTFSTLCACLEAEPKYKKKTEIVSRYLSKIKGNEESAIALVTSMLLPKLGNSNEAFKPNSLIRIFMDLVPTKPPLGLWEEQFKQTGDISIVIGNTYGHTSSSTKKSSISLSEVDDMLFELNGKSKRKEQVKIIRRILDRLYSREEVITFIRLLLGDLKIKAGVEHILNGVGNGAYDAYCTNQDMNDAVSASRSSVTTTPRVFVPVKPMSAQPCKSLAVAAEKVDRGDGQLYSEIKYDGERVQVHKKDSRVALYSRILKPMAEEKMEDMGEYVVAAFPDATTIILDAEMLMVCKKTGKPLPFGTLREDIADSANSCLFVFDILLYNDESMLTKPLSDRRALLEEVMNEQKYRVVLSELVKIKNGKEELDEMLQRVSKNDLEGLIVKDVEGQYKPGKRHWLKVKKDCLQGGTMVDTVDLVVLGAWHGKGKKRRMLSTFLMGCFDKKTDEWKTVTTVHADFDDATLERLQDEMNAVMVKSEDDEGRSFKLVKSLAMKPDYIVKDPKKAPVWELSGAELIKDATGSGRNHTANGISVRFPKFSRERRDKNWEIATSMEELEMLYESSTKSNSLAVTTKSTEDASTSGLEELTPKKRARAEEGKEVETAMVRPKKMNLK